MWQIETNEEWLSGTRQTCGDFQWCGIMVLPQWSPHRGGSDVDPWVGCCRPGLPTPVLNVFSHVRRESCLGAYTHVGKVLLGETAPSPYSPFSLQSPHGSLPSSLQVFPERASSPPPYPKLQPAHGTLYLFPCFLFLLPLTWSNIFQISFTFLLSVSVTKMSASWGQEFGSVHCYVPSSKKSTWPS